jgi:hypothetical protein
MCHQGDNSIDDLNKAVELSGLVIAGKGISNCPHQ